MDDNATHQFTAAVSELLESEDTRGMDWPAKTSGTESHRTRAESSHETVGSTRAGASNSAAAIDVKR